MSHAYVFSSVSEAIDEYRKNKEETKDCVVFDTATNRIVWRWMTQIEISQMREKRKAKRKEKKRKTHSMGVRRIIYNNANGCCQLCGRKIMFSDTTLDHIIPLALGGEDCISNLQIACKVCNGAKAAYLPKDFRDRVYDTLCFQMERKYGNCLKWKIVHRLLKSLM